MFDLVQAGERTWYIRNPNIMGIYQIEDKDVCLIDTGNSEKAAQAIQSILEEKGWNLKFIINTHTHIDHIGGNHYLMEKWGCPAYATSVDNAFANHTWLEAAYMYGGCPPEELRKIFAHPGPIGFRDIENFELPAGLEYIRLPGHSFGMIGIKTSDGVWFLGDCVLNQLCLKKYQFGYLVDVQGYLETLELLETLEGKVFIPAHGDVSEDIRPLAEGNRENIRKNLEQIRKICETGKSFDLIIQEIFTQYGVMPRMAQYALIGSTLRCYLTWLADRDYLEAGFEDNVLLWKNTDKALTL